MTPEISVERQFRFYCSCGATMVTGERTVTCTGCGATLGVHRVRRHRQQRPDAVTYYGRTRNGRSLKVRRVEKRRQHPNEPAPAPPPPPPPVASARSGSTFGAWVKSVADRLAPRIEAQRKQQEIRDEPRRLGIINEPPRLSIGTHVKVGPTRPDGEPHPHAGKTGRITNFINNYSDPYWRGLPSAMVKLDSGIEPPGFIWVSMECLEARPENGRAA